MKARQYNYSFTFTVRTPRTAKRPAASYTVTVEAKSVSQRGAAQKIRKQIAAMPDGAHCPPFHYSEVRVGLPALNSTGHHSADYCEFKRGKAIIKPKLSKEQIAEQVERDVARIAGRRSSRVSSF